MSHPTSQPPDPTRPTGGPVAYFAAVGAEDERLAGALADLRAEQAAGYITINEAAESRIRLLTLHLDRCAEAARLYLPGAEVSWPEVPGPDLETPEPGDPPDSLAGEVAAAVSDALHPEERPLQQPQHSAEWVRQAFPAWSVVLEDGQTWLAQRLNGHGPQLRAATLGLLVETINDWQQRERDAAEAALGILSTDPGAEPWPLIDASRPGR